MSEKKIADHIDRKILGLLREHEEMQPSELLSHFKDNPDKLSFPALSQRLGDLTNKKLLKMRREGVNKYYKLHEKNVQKAIETMVTDIFGKPFNLSNSLAHSVSISSGHVTKENKDASHEKTKCKIVNIGEAQRNAEY